MKDKLLIQHPSGYLEERKYIFKIIFEELLGLNYKCQEIPGNDVKISLANEPQAGILIWPDILFQNKEQNWLQEASLPKTPLPQWDVSKDIPEVKTLRSTIPVIYGRAFQNKEWFKHNGKLIYLGIDIAGSVFFLLTRYEELVLKSRDIHGRFPAFASIAYKEGFLDRPIVDEYIEILWVCMKRLWSHLNRREKAYKIYLSHDVDSPLWFANNYWIKSLKSVFGDILKRKDFILAYNRLKTQLTKDYSRDPYNTFAYIMDLSERFGLISAFYFKTDASDPKFDNYYDLETPWMKDLLKQIHERGHEIGLHTSYEAHKDFERTRNEFNRLLRITEKLGIKQEKWGGRQHYLRWENPISWQIWEDVGLDYDSTVGFADHVGFRCGTCQEFPVFNLITRKALRLRERPLIIMEGTLLGTSYMALSPEKAMEWIEHLSKISRQFNGIFTLLWHNSTLSERWQRDLYIKTLECITQS
jgi:hypothetical protein